MNTVHHISARREAGMNCLVTGATGFVGRAVVEALRAAGDTAVPVVRGKGERSKTDVLSVAVADDFADIVQCWPASAVYDCVIHLAARVHVTQESSSDPLQAFRATNVAGTLRVAQAAAQVGVRRFVYVSSIKAVDAIDHGAPLSEADTPRPVDPYGISKLEAEQALFELGQRTGMAIVVVRPPLVYGPGVRANFHALMQAVARGLPLPLGCADAPRSMIGLNNLVSAILACARHPAAAGKVYHVCDGEDVSVAELVRLLARAFGRSPRLVPVPAAVLRLAARATSKQDAMNRLFEPLRVNGSRIVDELDWRPPQRLWAGLQQTVDWYRTEGT
ncbi:NAD-dependent epimerase/dehydratase family protein [Cupriavidus sp. DB3]|uniref:NAD-dependent epimerase/dehydratase family protein n=1 Tax=Cupriavidus sp. DB3 TaxID=2873259 RepID=UPI001CF1BB89|nr:NAD-dependent epimerase/dehydratase family protein [Cupriavidus sp. DB3]MCA7085493.1 NAD-dependent epimerase/dehydratase family protein [Cupriavidus sp. DB3]